MKKIFKIFLIAIFISMSASFSAKAQYEGGITCTKQYSWPPVDFGYLQVQTSIWSCSNGCSYATTILTLLDQKTALADIENCG